MNRLLTALTLTALISAPVLGAEMKAKYPGDDAGSAINPYIYTDDDGNRYEVPSRFSDLPGEHTAGSFTNPLILNTPDGRYEITESFPDLTPGDGRGEAGSAVNPFRLDTGERIRPIE